MEIESGWDRVRHTGEGCKLDRNDRARSWNLSDTIPKTLDLLICVCCPAYLALPGTSCCRESYAFQSFVNVGSAQTEKKIIGKQSAVCGFRLSVAFNAVQMSSALHNEVRR